MSPFQGLVVVTARKHRASPCAGIFHPSRAWLLISVMKHGIHLCRCLSPFQRQVSSCEMTPESLALEGRHISAQAGRPAKITAHSRSPARAAYRSKHDTYNAHVLSCEMTAKEYHQPSGRDALRCRILCRPSRAWRCHCHETQGFTLC